MGVLRGSRRLRTSIRFLSWVTVVGLFIVNIVGFIDTETGSAYGCGHQWPLCNGSVIPKVWGLHTLIEFLHRGIVGVVTVVLLAVAVLAWWAYGRWLEVRVLILISVGFVFLEALLGALGVIFSDPPAVLATHFGVSLIAFNGVWLLNVVMRQIERTVQPDGQVLPLRSKALPPRFRFWSWFSFVFVYVAMYWGAYVTSTGDGGSFRGWPIPTETYAEVGSAFYVDIVHRLFALALLILGVWLVMAARKTRDERPDLYRGSATFLVTVGLQALSGALLIATRLNTNAFILHVALITVMFASVCFLVMQTFREPKRAFLTGETK